jgi:ligand-binding sensor domain-containing protein
MKIIKRNSFLVFFLLLHSVFVGQVKSIGIPEIRNYKRTDYKGGTQNWNIDQDANNNLYFANNDGMFMFDGTVWSKYELPNKSVVRSLKTHSSGKIFVGGYNEFGYFKPNSNGKLVYFSLSKFLKNKNTISIDIIWKIHQLKNEIIFQSFNAAYIFKNNQLKIIKAPTRFQFSFLVKNTLYFQDINKGILKYRNGNLTAIPNSTLLNNTEIWGMFPIDNKIIISTLDKGLYIYQNNKIAPWDTDANWFIKKNSGLGGVAMKNNHLVLNSVVDGVIICDRNGKIIQHINRKKGLQNNTSLTSFIDKNENLWLGLDNGISFLNENSPFTFFGSSYNLSTVYATIVHKEILYVATNQGVFYHRWSIPFREEDFQLINGTEGQAWNLQLINGTLFCAHNRGAFILNGNLISQTLDSTGY